ncbi:hypothetical protein D030_4232 [Vibrio parahaemolyticus AQ3810]|nr:hypothetical protein D030_4232 [Vibrio parahaemolyticus AQ3810]
MSDGVTKLERIQLMLNHHFTAPTWVTAGKIGFAIAIRVE